MNEIKPETRKWTEDSVGHWWDTECGGRHGFTNDDESGSPEDFGLIYCPYCDGTIKVEPIPEEEDDDE